jgi:sulfite reductase (NADPH) flavoprotein alpha-component
VINFIDKKFVEAAVKKGISDSPCWSRRDADKLKIFPNGRDECFDYVDVARLSRAEFAPEEFVALLRRLPPRFLFDRSALSAHPNEVHLTVATVRYDPGPAAKASRGFSRSAEW